VIIYGLMKYIEKIPLRYDRVMNALTLGNHARAHERLLSQVEPGMTVLDVGCGTGRFALAAAAKGARVTAVDASPEMLRVFRRALAERPDVAERVEIHECGAASIARLLTDRRFGLVTASLMLGELPAPVRRATIAAASSLLDENGTLLVCDEFWPESILGSLVYHLLFWIFFIPNFILTRTLIQPVQGFADDTAAAGLRVLRREELLCGAMSIVWLRRGSAEP